MGKTLVAYFSASGVTRGLAEKLAKVTGADLHEITPKVPYTDADLNWMDKKSRSSVEMGDKSYRPEIKGKVANMNQYDTVFVAFAIWWYVAPTIINTFLEQYDLSGKKVVTLATSGGSGMGNTNTELKNSCLGADLREGRRFAASVSENELKEWAESVVK